MKEKTAKVVFILGLAAIFLALLIGIFIPEILWYYAYPASEFDDYENDFYEGPRAESETRPFRGTVRYSRDGYTPDVDGFYLEGSDEYIYHEGVRPMEGSEVIVFINVDPSWGQAGPDTESVLIINPDVFHFVGIILSAIGACLVLIMFFFYNLPDRSRGMPISISRKNLRKVMIFPSLIILVFLLAFPLRPVIRDHMIYGDDSYKTHSDWETKINFIVMGIVIEYPDQLNNETYIMIPAVETIDGDLVEIQSFEEWEDMDNLSYEFEERSEGTFINISFIPKTVDDDCWFQIDIYFKVTEDFENFYLFEDVDPTDNFFHGSPGLSVFKVEDDRAYTSLYSDQGTIRFNFNYGRYEFVDYEYEWQGMVDVGGWRDDDLRDPGWFDLELDRRETHFWDDG